jgi:hypothetical protein
MRSYFQIEIVEVASEPLAQSPAGVEHERRDETSGFTTVLAKCFCKGYLLFVEVEAAVVPDAVVHGERAGEHRRMRGQRERHDSVRVVEQDARRCHLVEVRGRDAVVAVGG